jgi:hypothetical protein
MEFLARNGNSMGSEFFIPAVAIITSDATPTGAFGISLFDEVHSQDMPKDLTIRIREENATLADVFDAAQWTMAVRRHSTDDDNVTM